MGKKLEKLRNNEAADLKITAKIKNVTFILNSGPKWARCQDQGKVAFPHSAFPSH